jgi:hypothetical protein
MASMVEVICGNKSCRKKFQARTADVKRGWGKFCCKSCKAQEQETRTGQYKSYCCNRVNKLMQSSKVVDGFYANFSNEDDCDDIDETDYDDYAYDDDNGVSNIPTY